MVAKKLEEPDLEEVARLVAQNALSVAELQMRVTELENLLCAVNLWPEKFPASVLADALQESYRQLQKVTPFLIKGGSTHEVKKLQDANGPTPFAEAA